MLNCVAHPFYFLQAANVRWFMRFVLWLHRIHISRTTSAQPDTTIQYTHILMQHQDLHPEFQEEVLIKMKEEADKGKASIINYAYLLDRVKVNTGQLQVYGTQMILNSQKTSYEPEPGVKPDKFNERRRSVGLDTIESYTETMNSRYFGTLK